MSCVARSAHAGCLLGSSNAAVTWPCSAPWRTRLASPRAPSASPKASSRIDLPAPVSPVRTERPGAKSMSSRSIRTMSRMDRRDSIKKGGADLLEGLADPGALILCRLEPALFHQGVGVLVPRAVGEIVPEHRGRGLRLADDTERHVELSQPHQRLLDVARRLVVGDNHLEAVDRGG